VIQNEEALDSEVQGFPLLGRSRASEARLKMMRWEMRWVVNLDQDDLTLAIAVAISIVAISLAVF
jgi:hypothetical protein